MLPDRPPRARGNLGRSGGEEPSPGRAVRAGLLMLVAAACSGNPGVSGVEASTRGPPQEAQIVPVTKVTDGDTLHVTYRGEDERVRLIGVDTPEVSWYGGQGECYGEEAGLYARNRLSGQRVGLVFDEDVRDRYERLLAYVYVGGELFNLTLVRLGYATADPVAPNTSMADTFGSAEADARAGKRGLWSACPVA